MMYLGFVLSILCLLFCLPVCAKDHKQVFLTQEQCLKGMSSVCLWIPRPSLGDSSILLGKVDFDEIRPTIELRCRQAGLKVLPELTQDASLLTLSVGRGWSSDGGLIYCIHINCSEPVCITRNGTKMRTYGSIWTKFGLYGGAYAKVTKAEINEKCLFALDDFLNEWMKANGR